MSHEEGPSNEAGEAQSELAPRAVVVPLAAAAKPIWTYFLTPIAVIIGACIIAGVVWYTNDKGSASKPALVSAVSVTPETDAVSREPSTTAPQDLLTVFKGYVAQLGMDQNAFVACLSKPESVALVNKQLQRGTALGINGTPTFVINNKMVVGTQPTAIFDEVIAAELKGSPTTLDGYSAAIKAMAATSPPSFEILPAKVDVSDAEIEGDPGAKVIVAEFSDFQCPFCKRWTDATLPHLRTTLGKDVALAFLNFPIPQLHPNAGNASVAAVCAGEQGKFWQMHDLLFEKQTEWAPLKAN
ncbi:MAG: thioredoxin domain-containing protein [Tepidiformaceae bacterium]